MKNSSTILKSVEKNFNFRRVKLKLGETKAKINYETLILTIDENDPFFQNSDFAGMLAVREVYRAIYGYDGVAADILANKSTIKTGFSKELANYYYLLLTEHKNKEIQTSEEFLELCVPHLSFLSIDESNAEIFLKTMKYFSFDKTMKKKTEPLFSLFRNPYRNFEKIKKEVENVCQ
jgi:hypothetical protein